MKLSKRALITTVALMLAMTMSVFGTIAYLTSTAQATNTFTVGDVQIDLDETDVDEDGNPKYPVDTDDDGEPDRVIVVDKEDGTITIIDPKDPDDPTDDEVIEVIEPTGKDDDGNYTYPDDVDVDGDGDEDEITVDEDGNIVLDPDSDDEKIIEPGKDKENEYNLVPGMEYLKDPTVTVKAGSEESYVRMRVAVTGTDDAQGFCAAIVKDMNTDNWQFVGLNDKGELEFWYVEDGEFVAVEPGKDEDLVLPALFTTIGVPGEVERDELAELAGVKMDIYGDAIQSASFDDAEEAWDAFDGQNNRV